MDAAKIISQLRSRYPGGTLLRFPEIGNALEIVYETRRYHDRNHCEAFDVIVRSEPHHHNRTVEVDRILFGNLVLHVNEHIFRLTPGDMFIITPGQVHWAEGDPAGTWVKVVSSPIWTHSPTEDYHLDTLIDRDS